jgi:hypothetical protein
MNKLDEKTSEQLKWKMIEAQILQIFGELKVVLPLPMMQADVPEDAEILLSTTFLVEKFLETGDFKKVKACLVANEAQQSRKLYPNRSSPAVGIHSIMTCLTMAALLKDYIMMDVDVKGAYIQTEMTGSPVFMKLDKKLMDSVIAIPPHLGTLYTKLLKALYECIQSSNLWYNKLTMVLKKLQYELCPVDPCVMRQIRNNKVHIIIIYVDQLLLLTDKLKHIIWRKN